MKQLTELKIKIVALKKQIKRCQLKLMSRKITLIIFIRNKMN